MRHQSDIQDPAGYTTVDRLSVLGFLVVAIAIPAVIVKLHFLGEAAPFHWSLQTFGGTVAAVLTFALVAYNLHFCFIHPRLHMRRFGTMDGFRYVSGAPLVGGVLIFLASLLFPANPIVGSILLILFLLDPSGIHLAAFVFVREMLGWHPSPEAEVEKDLPRDP